MSVRNKPSYIRRQKRRLAPVVEEADRYRELQDFKAKYGDDGMSMYRACMDVTLSRPGGFILTNVRV